jgi:hypothetical protein
MSKTHHGINLARVIGATPSSLGFNLVRGRRLVPGRALKANAE